MSQLLTVSLEDIIYHLKLSCQIPGLLEAIASRKIISETAAKAGIKVDQDELQQAADNVRLANKLIKAEETWEWLQKHHLSVDDFEELAQINLLSSKLASHLFADKVEPFFYENQLNYVGAVVYEIILDDEDLALELFYALQENEISFQEIARQYIENPEIRRAGGYQGIQHRSDFRPEIAAAVFAATPPQILKPIITPKGAHLIWVEEIIQPQLDESLRVHIMGNMFMTWLKQQVAAVEIAADIESNSHSQSTKEVMRQAS